MATIPLNRRFVEWQGTDLSDLSFRAYLSLRGGGMPWDELLDKRRIVILAEAGSGKSTELKEAARGMAALGRFSFGAAVEDVGNDGLAAALSPGAQARMADWKAS